MRKAQIVFLTVIVVSFIFVGAVSAIAAEHFYPKLERLSPKGGYKASLNESWERPNHCSVSVHKYEIKGADPVLLIEFKKGSDGYEPSCSGGQPVWSSDERFVATKIEAGDGKWQGEDILVIDTKTKKIIRPFSSIINNGIELMKFSGSTISATFHAGTNTSDTYAKQQAMAKKYCPKPPAGATYLIAFNRKVSVDLSAKEIKVKTLAEIKECKMIYPGD